MSHRIIGKTAAGTVITLGRRDSQGLPATLRNAEHHAKAVIPFINALLPIVDYLPLREWRQFNNVHLLLCRDGRVLVVRPRRSRGYDGLTLTLRGADEQEVPLAHFVALEDLPQIGALLQTVCRPLGLEAIDTSDCRAA